MSGHISAYLKRSSNQYVKWHPWSEDAFERAAKEDKPVFLSSGAIWCHWCHVMAEECFYNKEIAGFLNDNFICIKLDRDERPDIDRRYQAAVALMGSQTGWPLSVFLTPDKKPFYGGTYFPPEERAGRPGFKNILKAVLSFYRNNRDELSEYTLKVIDSLKPASEDREELKPDSLDRAVSKILSAFDPENGGFGKAPKFPMPGAIEFLTNRYLFAPDERIGDAVRKTLTSMALGGFHDHIGGGFHRYTTDEAWVMPHFEKMADDNAFLLRNYLSGYYVFGDTFFKEIAEDIISFTRTVLSDPEGGFYASQDADVTPYDEGGYFTWTGKEMRSILNEDEYRAASLFLLHDAGSMHHDASKKVLYAKMKAEEAGEAAGNDPQEFKRLIAQAREKLLMARNCRQTPFVDRTMYTSINGMYISSYILGYRILNDISLKNFALKSIDRIMSLRFIDGTLYHSEGTKALFDDYAHIINALISAYEVTGKRRYTDLAEHLMETCIAELWDKENGGFYDSTEQLLGLRIKGIEDIQCPSANSISIVTLLQLNFMTGKRSYLKYAEKVLECFSATAQEIGIHAGYYFCALDAYFNALDLKVYAAPDSSLSKTVLSSLAPYMNVLYGEENGSVLPCFKHICHEPVRDPESWNYFLRKNVYNGLA